MDKLSSVMQTEGKTRYDGNFKANVPQPNFLSFPVDVTSNAMTCNHQCTVIHPHVQTTKHIFSVSVTLLMLTTSFIGSFF